MRVSNSEAIAAHSFTKPVVVVNRHAGGGKAKRQWQEIHAALARSLGGFVTLETERPGHAEGLVRQALQDGFDRVVVVGGDGTYSEAVNGFFLNDALINPAASLAIVCAGTASDLARTLRLSSGMAAADRAGQPATLHADVIRVRIYSAGGGSTSRHFINVAHVGLGGEVARRFYTVPRFFGGHIAYFQGLTGSLFTYRPRVVDITVDGARYSGPCMDVVVANGAYDGGGMHVAPRARLDSGCVEVLFVEGVSCFKAIRNIPCLYTGTLEKRPEVKVWSAKRLRIEATEPVYVNLDGECVGMLPIEMEVLPSMLNMVDGSL